MGIRQSCYIENISSYLGNFGNKGGVSTHIHLVLKDQEACRRCTEFLMRARWEFGFGNISAYFL